MVLTCHARTDLDEPEALGRFPVLFLRLGALGERGVAAICLVILAPGLEQRGPLNVRVLRSNVGDGHGSRCLSPELSGSMMCKNEAGEDLFLPDFTRVTEAEERGFSADGQQTRARFPADLRPQTGPSYPLAKLLERGPGSGGGKMGTDPLSASSEARTARNDCFAAEERGGCSSSSWQRADGTGQETDRVSARGRGWLG